MKNFRGFLIIWLFFCLSSNLLKAKEFAIKSGRNYSAFRDSDNETKIGFNIGLEKEWNFHKRWGLLFGASYTTRGGILRDKIFGSTEMALSITEHNDLVCSTGFVDIPLLINYRISTKRGILFNFYSGGSFALGAYDNSKRNSSHQSISDEDLLIESNIDYYLGARESELGGPLGNSALNLVGGTGIRWRCVSFELRYSQPVGGLYIADDIKLKGKKYHSLNLLFGLWLPIPQIDDEDKIFFGNSS